MLNSNHDDFLKFLFYLLIQVVFEGLFFEMKKLFVHFKLKNIFQKQFWESIP